MSVSTNFNPHDNKTADGKVITENMLVIDYDMRVGFVIGDSTSEYMCDNGFCNGDHWFTVEHTDDTTKDFNGTRLSSRGW